MANVSKFKVPNGTTYTIKDSTARSDATTAKTLATSAMNNIATIQTSSTASKAYSVGDYLVLNNQLYEVTTAIASGETLTVGTNISATKVGDELTSLNNSLTLTKILNNVAVSNTSYTLSDSIENYSELVIRVRTNSLKCTTLSIPVDDIVTDGYSSEHQYIVQTNASTANAYILYVQIAFTSSNTMQIIAHDMRGWTGTLYISVYAR